MTDIRSDIIINVDTSIGIAEIKNLQRQIAELNAQLLRSGAQQARAAQNIQRNLINNINATGQFAANVRSISSTAESFTTALERNKLSMGEYFRYAGGATKTFGRLFRQEFDTIQQVAESRVKTLQTQYIKLGRDASGSLKAISVRPLALDMESLATKTAIAAQRQQLFNQLVKQGSTNLLNFGKNTQWAGRQLMVGFTIPLAYLGSFAGKTFMQMEEQAIKFKRVYGDSFTATEETDKMIKQIQALASEFTKYGVAAEKTMEMAAQAAAMGLTNADLLAQVNEATRLSVLGGVEQQQALETTISLMSAFGTSARDLTKDIDFLNAVENQTVTAIEDLTIAIPKAAPVIKQLGGDVQDLAFFLTAMKEGGINASEGANALKSGLASLINPTGKAAEFLQGFGINLKGIVDANKGDVRGLVLDFANALDTLDPLNRARAIEQLFGKFQFARLSTLFQNVVKEGTQAQRVVAITRQTTEELAILSERELKRVEDSPMFKLKKAFEDLKVSLVPLGEAFVKAITPIVEFAKGFLDRFNAMGEGAKQFAVIATTVVAGIGPVLLMTFGLVANGVANLIKMFAFLSNIFKGTGKSSNDLGTSTDYMTQQQLEAAAVAASLDQSHSKLIQTFGLEAAAVDKLAVSYGRAVVAQSRLLGVNPEAPLPGPTAGGGRGKAPRVRGYNRGVLSVPGPKGAGDIVPAMLSPGEAVIPAKQSQKYSGLIQAVMTDSVPGFRFGRLGAAAKNLNPFPRIAKAIKPEGTKYGVMEGLIRLITGNRTGVYGSGASQMYEQAAALKFIRSNPKIAVRMRSEDFMSLVASKDKRYKSVFETGSSYAGDTPEKRAIAEKALLGIKENADPASRPVYGYLFGQERGLHILSKKGKDGKFLPPFQERLFTRLTGQKPAFAGTRRSAINYIQGNTGSLMNPKTYMYGDMAMILKKRAIKDRTTYTYGDSYNNFGGRFATPAPLGSKSRKKFMASMTSKDKNFFEAQILGGFTLKDVKRIVVTEPAKIPQLQAALGAAGFNIPVGMPRFTMLQRLKKLVYGDRAKNERLPFVAKYGPRAGKYTNPPLDINGRKVWLSQGTAGVEAMDPVNAQSDVIEALKPGREPALYFDPNKTLQMAHQSPIISGTRLLTAKELEDSFDRELEKLKSDIAKGRFPGYNLNPDQIKAQFKEKLDKAIDDAGSKADDLRFKHYSNVIEPWPSVGNQGTSTLISKKTVSSYIEELDKMPRGLFGSGVLARLPRGHGISSEIIRAYANDITDEYRRLLVSDSRTSINEPENQEIYRRAEQYATRRISDPNAKRLITSANRLGRLGLTFGVAGGNKNKPIAQDRTSKGSGTSRRYLPGVFGDVQKKVGLLRDSGQYKQVFGQGFVDELDSKFFAKTRVDMPREFQEAGKRLFATLSEAKADKLAVGLIKDSDIIDQDARYEAFRKRLNKHGAALEPYKSPGIKKEVKLPDVEKSKIRQKRGQTLEVTPSTRNEPEEFSMRRLLGKGMGRGLGALAGFGLAGSVLASLLPSLSQNRYAKGVVSVPGPKGAGDVVPAMLSPGEAVIPAKQSKKYAGLIQGMIAGDLPGYRFGRVGYRVSKTAKPQEIKAETFDQDKLGGTPGGMRTLDGEKYYVKRLASKAEATSEILTSALFSAMGNRGPRLQLLNTADSRTVASKIIRGLVPSDRDSLSAWIAKQKDPQKAAVDVAQGLKRYFQRDVPFNAAIGNIDSHAQNIMFNPRTRKFENIDLGNNTLAGFTGLPNFGALAYDDTVRMKSDIFGSLSDTLGRSAARKIFKSLEMTPSGSGTSIARDSSKEIDQLASLLGFNLGTTSRKDPATNPANNKFIKQLIAENPELASQLDFGKLSGTSGKTVEQALRTLHTRLKRAKANPYQFYADGVVSVPGPKGAGDIVPAMLSPGEAVIPTKMADKYAPLINGMIADSIPGYSKGKGKKGPKFGANYTGTQSKGKPRTGTVLTETTPQPGVTTQKRVSPNVTRQELNDVKKQLRGNTFRRAVNAITTNITGAIATGIQNANMAKVVAKDYVAGYKERFKQETEIMNRQLAEREKRVQRETQLKRDAKWNKKFSEATGAKQFGPSYKDTGTGRFISPDTVNSRFTQFREDQRFQKLKAKSDARMAKDFAKFDKKYGEAGIKMIQTGSGAGYYDTVNKRIMSNEAARARMAEADEQRKATRKQNFKDFKGRMGPGAMAIGGIGMTAGMGLSMSQDPLMQQAGMAVMAVSGIVSILPMLMNPVGAVIAVFASLGVAAFMLQESLNNARKEAANTAKAMSSGADAMQGLAEFAGTVSPTETMDRVRAERRAGYNIVAGKNTFGASFLESEDGKKLLEQAQISKLQTGGENSAELIAIQLSQAVASNVLTPEQASSIADNLGQAMKDYDFAVDVQGKMIELLGPGGEDLTKDPITVFTRVVEERRGSVAGAGEAKDIINNTTGNIGFLNLGRTNNTEVAAAEVEVAQVILDIVDMNQQNLDTLELEHIKRMETLKAAGDLAGMEEERNKYIEDRARLMKEGADQLRSEIKYISDLENSGDGLKRSSAEQIVDNMENSLEAMFEGLDQKTKDANQLAVRDISDNTNLGLTFAEKASILAVVDVENMDLYKQMLELFDPKDKDNAGVWKKIAELAVEMGPGTTEDMWSVLTGFSDTESGKQKASQFVDYVVNLRKTGDVAGAENAISTMTELNKLKDEAGNPINLDQFIDDEGNVTERFTKITTALDKLDVAFANAKGKKITYEVMTTTTGIELTKEAQAYFNSLDPEQQKRYVTSYLVLTESIDLGTEEGRKRVEAWKKEKILAGGGSGNTTLSSYYSNMDDATAVGLMAQENAAQVTSPSSLTENATTASPTATTKAPTTQKEDPYESMLRNLRRVRNSTINVTGGLKELRRVLGKKMNMTAFAGVESRLLSSSENISAPLAEYFANLDEKTQKLFFTIGKNGKVTLTEAGKLWKQAFEERAIGNAAVGLQASLKSIRAQNKAVSTLVSLGLDWEAASELANDEVIASAIASGKNVDELKKIVDLKKQEKKLAEETNALLVARVTIDKNIQEGLLIAATGRLSFEEQQAINASQALQEMIKKNQQNDPAFARLLAQEVAKITLQRQIAASNAVKEAIRSFREDRNLESTIRSQLSALGPVRVQAILNSPELMELYKSTGGVLGQEFYDRLNQLLSDPKVLGQIFEEGLTNAFAAFDVQEKAIELKFQADTRSLTDPEEGIIPRAERRIALVEDQIDDYEYMLESVTEKEQAINEKYEARYKALEQIHEINRRLVEQQQAQLDIAGAITRGDISAAASAVQAFRARVAQDRMTSQKEALDLAREKELNAVTAEYNGKILTRKQIEEEVKNLKKQIVEIQEKEIEPAERSLRLASDARDIAISNVSVLGMQRAGWEGIQNAVDQASINNAAFVTSLTSALSITEALKKAYGELGGSVAGTVTIATPPPASATTQFTTPSTEKPALGPTLNQNSVGPTAVSVPNIITEPQPTPAAPKEMTVAEKQIAELNRRIAITRWRVQNAKSLKISNADVQDLMMLNRERIEEVRRLGGAVTGDAVKPGTAGYDKEIIKLAPRFASGGLVTTKFASMGTDIVPAMLTPGEFVVQRYAVDNFGLDNLKAINNGAYNGGAVYNSYELNVNVKSDANPDQIARAVMTQIKQIDSQRIRGNRF